MKDTTFEEEFKAAISPSSPVDKTMLREAIAELDIVAGGLTTEAASALPVSALQRALIDQRTMIKSLAPIPNYVHWTTPDAYGAVGDYWLENGSVNPTPTDNTAALQKMLDENVYIRFGNRGYRTGYYTDSLKLRAGHVIEAPYSAGSTDISVTRGTYLVGKPGITEILDTITNNAGYIRIDGLGLYGRDYSCEGVNRTQIRSYFGNMHVIRCRSGFNRANVPGMADTYGRSGCHFFNITACDNIFGALNTVDSKFIFGRFASNKRDGICFNEGANDNFILGTKLDFNDRWGLRAYASNRVTVITENVDRNGMGGISNNAGHNWRIDAFAHRNGRWGSATATINTTSGSNIIQVTAIGADTQLAEGQVITAAGIPAGTTITTVGDGIRISGGVNTYALSANATATATGVAATAEQPVERNCHVVLTNVTGLIMTLRTKSGADDDGAGNVGAKSSVVYSGACGFTLVGDLTGCTGAPVTAISGSTLDNRSSIMAIGATNYVYGVSPWANQTGQLANAANETVVVSNLPPVIDNNIRTYTVVAVAKRSDNNSTAYRISFPVTLVRGTGNASVIVGTIREEGGAANAIALSGTPSMALIGTITSDSTGTQLSFPVTSQYATANMRLRIRVRADD